MRFSTITTALAGLGLATAALPQLHIKGSKFFDSNGSQFFIKGVAYQLSPDDPLVNTAQCKLDAALMKTLGANTIRVYHVDPTANHDGCMQAFDDAGIYLFVDLDTFTTQINPDTPAWTKSQLSAFTAVLDTFEKYDNLAGVLVGNEVLTTGNNSVAAPYVKAAARDVKAYRATKKYRDIPVGYSAADISSLRPMLQNYLACGNNASEAIDFYCLNAYEWCGDSTFETSGYSQLNANVTSYDIPIFFSETGCNTVKPRTFADQAAILGPNMDSNWSGAIIYEWIEEDNDYGIVSYGASIPASVSGQAPTYPRSGTPTPVAPDFTNLQNEWKTLNPTGIKEADYTPSFTAPACPAYTSDTWAVNGDVALPTLGQTFDAAVQSSMSAGSTGAAASASSTATPKGGASPAGEVKAGAMGLGVVMAVAVAWL